MQETVYLNRMEAITGCTFEGKELIDTATDMIKKIMAGDEMSAIEESVQLVRHLANAIDNCESAPAESKMLIGWLLDRFSSKQSLVDYTTANSLTHAQEIYQHVEDVNATFMGFAEPEKTGKSIAQTAFWALGPANPAVPY